MAQEIYGFLALALLAQADTRRGAPLQERASAVEQEEPQVVSVPAQVNSREQSPAVRAASRAPWSTAFALALAVGAAAFLIGLVNLSTGWRSDAREAWSIALLVFFITGGLATLTAPPGRRATNAFPFDRAWALARPWLFALLLALACAASVTLSDLNLWHTTPGTAFVHALIQACLVALIAPVSALSGPDRG